jgi:AcrR family transcriptional regulator
MLDAAFKLFCERGYQGTTMAAVGGEAGVAEQTVYFTFHSKSALFQEVLIASRTVAGEPREVEQRPWFTEALETPDQRRALALSVEGGIDIFRRVAPLASTIVAAELIDQDVATIMDSIRAQRRQSMTELVSAIEANGRLAISASEAVDVIDVVESMGTFNAFVTGCGWTVEDFKAWSYFTLTQILVPLPPARAAKADLAATQDLSYHSEIASRVTRFR